jgi:hypothetical protein
VRAGWRAAEAVTRRLRADAATSRTTVCSPNPCLCFGILYPSPLARSSRLLTFFSPKFLFSPSVSYHQKPLALRINLYRLYRLSLIPYAVSK